MLLFHKKYQLGDIPYNEELKPDWSMSYMHELGSWDAMGNKIVERFNPVIIKPMYLYDHSGITIKTSPFSSHWDSMSVGFVFISHDDFMHECKKKTEETLKMAETILDSEIEEYDLYLRGEGGFAPYQMEIEIDTGEITENGETKMAAEITIREIFRDIEVVKWIADEYEEDLEVVPAILNAIELAIEKPRELLYKLNKL